MIMISSDESFSSFTKPAAAAAAAPALVEEDDTTSGAATSIPTTTSEDAMQDDLTETSFENHWHVQSVGPPAQPRCPPVPAPSIRGPEEQSSRLLLSSRSLRPRDERKLFVGGLPHNVTNKEFRSYFKEFGTILDSVVLMERDHKRPRGFGFVKFQDVQVARTLLSKSQTESGLKMRGKKIDLKVAEPKEAQKKSGAAAPVLVQEGNVPSPSYYTTMMAPPQFLTNEGLISAPFVPFLYNSSAAPFASYNEYNTLISKFPNYFVPMMARFDPSSGLYYYPYPVSVTTTPFTDPRNATTLAGSPGPNVFQW